MIRRTSNAVSGRTWVTLAGAMAISLGGLTAFAAGAGPASRAVAGGGAAATQASPVHMCPAPKGGEAKAFDNAKQILGTPTSRTRGGPRVAPDMTTLAIRPLTAAYGIDLAPLAQGKGLEAAVPRNTFLYAALLEGKVRSIVSIEIVGDAAGQFRGMEGPDQMGLVTTIDALKAGEQVRSGINSETLVEGIDALAGMEQLRGGSYEVRKLELPASVITPHPTQVLWLKADKGDGDWVYTLKEPLYPGNLKQQTLFKAADFVKVMHDWADKSMKAPPMAPGAGG
jgi:hypothetical protein